MKKVDGNNRKLSVTLVIAHLGLGGAERVLAHMADYWAQNGRRVTLMTLDHGNDPPFYALGPSVARVDFGWSRVWRAGIPKLRMPCALLALRSALHRTRPDIIISFLNTTNVSVLMASYGLGVPVIVSERNDPRHDTVSTYWERRRRWLYRSADALVVQTQAALDYFAPPVRRRGCVIPNPVRLPEGVRGGALKNMPCRTRREIVAVGRLVEQKGFDLLLSAFSLVAAANPAWSLTIWGEGAERPGLEAMVHRLGLGERVRFPGTTRDIFEQLPEADLFVLSSRYEGFPNALCEAMACGLPVVSFDCPSGPREIIRDGIDGILVPPENPRALADAMQRLMEDEDLRLRLAGSAARIVERFSPERIFGMWEDLLLKCVNGR